MPSCRVLFGALGAAALVAMAGAGACGSDVPERRGDNPLELLRAWNGPPPQLSVVLGPGASQDQREDCNRTLLELGFQNPPGAPFSVLIDIADEEKKILHVRSQTRGDILQQSRPAWPVRDLCRDALALGLRALHAESAAMPPGSLVRPAAMPAPLPVYSHPAYTPMAPMPQAGPILPTPSGYAGGGPDDPWQVLTRWTGPAPQVAVGLGSRASVRQREICNETIRRFGISHEPAASVVAQIDVDNSSQDSEANLLRVTSQRGIMIYGFRPGWKVEQLCTDALAQALRVFLSEYGRIQPAPIPGRL